MSEGTAYVIAADDQWVWLQPERKSGCSSCSATSFCGASVLSKGLNRPPPRLKAANDIGARAGDHVVLSLPDDKVLRAAALTYLAPITALIAGILIGLGLGLGELPATGLGLAAMGGAFLFIRRKFTGAEAGFAPKVLRFSSTSHEDIKQ